MRQIGSAGFVVENPSARLKRYLRSGGVAAALLSFCFSNAARADEGGVSFWVPGFFGSMAATPLTPGFSFANIYYHTSVSAGGNVAFARQVSRGNITANFTGGVNANLDARADLYLAIPSYTFATPVLGGQANVLLIVPYGRNRVSVDATLTGALGPLPFTDFGRQNR